jgi:hypothetical protein
MNERYTTIKQLLYGIRAGRLAFASVLCRVCDYCESTSRARVKPSAHRECREAPLAVSSPHRACSASLSLCVISFRSRVAHVLCVRSNRVCRIRPPSTTQVGWSCLYQFRSPLPDHVCHEFNQEREEITSSAIEGCDL